MVTRSELSETEDGHMELIARGEGGELIDRAERSERENSAVACEGKRLFRDCRATFTPGLRGMKKYDFERSFFYPAFCILRNN